MFDEVQRLLNLAEIYIEDGAPRTAADRLRKAADVLDEIAEKREALIR